VVICLVVISLVVQAVGRGALSCWHSLCAGATVQVGVDPSKVVITKLKLDNDRRSLLTRKKGGEGGKGKFSAAEVDTMENID
jgi:hypothetical protein